ncbi:nuclear transport factor 2 family protein [Saccharothrix coeruleofusca]|uniref:SnoaL-like domain-containing protein n=1 Tax=Saccharothrix coeruleofusca TaxID=33919 RepID=A0A918EFT9_9PSEU|nr:nuclear transport factor 2 family protein [Saccharothrix coeruleofusca]GGP66685.1 hypothetical protein GCM10010185_44350 [Saccharothrix coeruleofusca]
MNEHARYEAHQRVLAAAVPFADRDVIAAVLADADSAMAESAVAAHIGRIAATGVDFASWASTVRPLLSGRAFLLRRLDEWCLFDEVRKGVVPEEERLRSASDWLQRKISAEAVSPDLLELLATTSRTKRVRAEAARRRREHPPPTPPRPGAAEVIREHVDAFNSRDLEGLLAGFTDDAVWITGTSVARGRAELAELFGNAMAGLLPSLVVDNLLVVGDRAACQLTEELSDGGERLTFSIAGFYQLRDGRIASAKIYREGSAEIA